MAVILKYGLLGVAICSVLAMLAGCGSSLVMVSDSKNAGDIKIDGSNEDWEGRIGAIQDKKVGVGVRKDEVYRYVCFQTSDESLIRKIAFTGLIFWFNADGSEDKMFGIKFPAGRKKEFRPDGSGEMPEGMEMTDKGRMRGKGVMPEKIPGIDFSKSEVELIQGEDDMFPRTVDIGRAASKYKILLSASLKEDVLFIEIAVPHKNGFLDLPSDTKEGFFGLGFETTKMEMPSMRGGGSFGGGDDGPPDFGGGGMPPGGGMGGGGGRMPPGGMGGGGMPPRMNGETSSQFVLWLKITDNVNYK